MNFRPALLATAALAAAFGLRLALGRWGAGGNRDLASLARSVQQGEGLEAQFQWRRRRDDAKHALAAEVIAGRMSLREAAARFRRLDEDDPAYPPGTSL